MIKLRAIVGLIAGAFLILSSGVHSTLGWTHLRSALEKTRAPADLVSSLALGWHFAGAAMLAFGLLVVGICVTLLVGRSAPLGPVRLIALFYLAYGAWSYAASERQTFFAVAFLLPGVLLAITAIGPSRARPAPSVALPQPVATAVPVPPVTAAVPPVTTGSSLPPTR